VESPDWYQRFEEICEEAEENSRKRMEILADILASDQRIDEIERALGKIADPLERARQEQWVSQARSNNQLTQLANQQAEQISQLQQALVIVAVRVGELEAEVRHLRGSDGPNG
jgi:HEAT repeat protein